MVIALLSDRSKDTKPSKPDIGYYLDSMPLVVLVAICGWAAAQQRQVPEMTILFAALAFVQKLKLTKLYPEHTSVSGTMATVGAAVMAGAGLDGLENDGMSGRSHDVFCAGMLITGLSVGEMAARHIWSSISSSVVKELSLNLWIEDLQLNSVKPMGNQQYRISLSNKGFVSQILTYGISPAEQRIKMACNRLSGKYDDAWFTAEKDGIIVTVREGRDTQAALELMAEKFPEKSVEAMVVKVPPAQPARELALKTRIWSEGLEVNRVESLGNDTYRINVSAKSSFMSDIVPAEERIQKVCGKLMDKYEGVNFRPEKDVTNSILVAVESDSQMHKVLESMSYKSAHQAIVVRG